MPASGSRWRSRAVPASGSGWRILRWGIGSSTSAGEWRCLSGVGTLEITCSMPLSASSPIPPRRFSSLLRMSTEPRWPRRLGASFRPDSQLPRRCMKRIWPTREGRHMVRLKGKDRWVQTGRAQVGGKGKACGVLQAAIPLKQLGVNGCE
eukprot:1374544-Pleurochrysis_carterae.AAC.1